MFRDKSTRIFNKERKGSVAIMNDWMDKPQEECGVFGVWSMEDIDAAQWIYYGLVALQHRGQESAGIVVCDTKGPIGNICAHKGMGLVSEVFHTDVLSRLRGNIGIGHVRYSTAGASCVENAQPFFYNYSKGTLALAHNGNITNAEILRKALQAEGAVFNGTSDSEVLAYAIAKERMNCFSIEDAVCKVAQAIKGGYALLIMSPQKLVGVRDPWGLKPLCIGKLGQTYFMASESAAITAVGAEFVRDVEPGEIVTITKEGLHTELRLHTEEKAHCVFEYILH